MAVLFKKSSDCPDVANHTPVPDGYVEYADWADEHRETHVQRQCPTCGFWSIWTPK